MDQVANHCGVHHWWMEDLPFDDWINYQKGFENNEKTIYSNHRRTTNQDIYASHSDKQGMVDGWFVESMPDLNQRNPFMAKYIIQNSIWWIETAGLSGIRQDTYPYPDKAFMSDWAGAIMNEYPNFSIVGEEWSLNP
jgi:glycosidase